MLFMKEKIVHRKLYYCSLFRKFVFVLKLMLYRWLLNIFSSVSNVKSIGTKNFWKAAPASKWGRVKHFIGILRRGRRFKNKSTDFDSYNWRTISGMPMGARGYPGTQIWHIWDFMIHVKIPTIKNSQIGDFWKKIYQSSQFGDFAKVIQKRIYFQKIKSTSLEIDHKVPNMLNFGARVASGTHGHARYKSENCNCQRDPTVDCGAKGQSNEKSASFGGPYRHSKNGSIFRFSNLEHTF